MLTKSQIIKEEQFHALNFSKFKATTTPFAKKIMDDFFQIPINVAGPLGFDL